MTPHEYATAPAAIQREEETMTTESFESRCKRYGVTYMNGEHGFAHCLAGSSNACVYGASTDRAERAAIAAALIGQGREVPFELLGDSLPAATPEPAPPAFGVADVLAMITDLHINSCKDCVSATLECEPDVQRECAIRAEAYEDLLVAIRERMP